MGMFVTARKEDALIISMSGKWMGTDEERQMIEVVREEVKNGATKLIILDLKKVEWANSYGIGALAGAMTSAHNSTAKLVLASVPPEIKKLLDLSFLSKVLPSYPNVDKALKALE